MSRRLKRAAVVVVAFLALFIGAQLIRPNYANPAIDASHTIGANPGVASELAGILDRSCGDCHSNHTRWPWYARVAPLSWLMANGVKEGRKAVNFSEWSTYSPDQQHRLLVASCKDATTGKMPVRGWTTLHPEARLSAKDVATICAAAR